MIKYSNVDAFGEDSRYLDLASGQFSLKYNDTTHLDAEDWRELLSITIDGPIEGTSDSERSFKLRLALDAKFSVNEHVKKQRLHVLTDTLSLSAMRTGIIAPLISEVTAEQLLQLKRAKGIVLLPDTNSLYNGTLHWLLNVLRGSTLWILPFVMSLTQMQSREASLKAMSRSKKDTHIGQALRSRAFVNAGLGLLERNHHRYQVLELDPALLRYMKMPDKNGFDSDESEVLEDRLLIEGIHAILRSTRTRAKQMVVTSDVTLSRVLSAEGIENICLPTPMMTEAPVSNLRYDAWAQSFMGTTVRGLAWDLAHTFSSVRIDSAGGEKVRLSCYWPGKVAHNWHAEQLLVEWKDISPATATSQFSNADSQANAGLDPLVEGNVLVVEEASDVQTAGKTHEPTSLSDAALPQASLPLVLRLAGTVYKVGSGTVADLVANIDNEQPSKGNATRGFEVLRRAKIINFELHKIVPRKELDKLQSDLTAGDLDAISKQLEEFEPYKLVLDVIRDKGSLVREEMNGLLEEALKAPVSKEASIRLVRYHILLGQAWTDGSIWRDGSNRPSPENFLNAFGAVFDNVAHDNIAKISDFLPNFCRATRMSPWAMNQAIKNYIGSLSAGYSLQYAVGGKPMGTDKVITGSLLDIGESIVPVDRIEVGGRPVLTLGRVKS